MHRPACGSTRAPRAGVVTAARSSADAGRATRTTSPTPAPIAQVRSSGGIERQWTGYNDQNDDIAAVYDGVDPLSSADESNLYFRMRPAVGSPAWIEYQFSTLTRISQTEAYWVDDQRFCRLPESWRIVYKSGDTWEPVVARAYGVSRNTFNRVEFDPVSTTAVRIEVEPETVHYKTGEIGPPAAMFLIDPVDPHRREG